MGPKAEPAAPVEMKMDNMEDTPAARAAFKEAIEKSAAEFKDNLNQNI
jgi:glutaredoxin 2